MQKTFLESREVFLETRVTKTIRWPLVISCKQLREVQPNENAFYIIIQKNSKLPWELLSTENGWCDHFNWVVPIENSSWQNPMVYLEISTANHWGILQLKPVMFLIPGFFAFTIMESHSRQTPNSSLRRRSCQMLLCERQTASCAGTKTASETV